MTLIFCSFSIFEHSVGFGEFAKARQFNTYVNYVITPSYEIHQKLGLLRYTISGEKLDQEMPFRNFLAGRILWDEGMASAAHLWTTENPGGLIVGLVGADHVLSDVAVEFFPFL